MKPTSPFKPIITALAAGAVTVLAGTGFAAALRANATRTSHQLPEAETLFVPTTPTSPALVVTGRKLYLDSCARCHAADVRGDEGPDLHGLAMSDRYIATVIKRGIPHEMPSFAKKHGTDDILALTAYLRSLDHEPGQPAE